MPRQTYFRRKNSTGLSSRAVGSRLLAGLVAVFCLSAPLAYASLTAAGSTETLTRIPSSNPTLEQWVKQSAQHLHPDVELEYPVYLGLLYRQARFGTFWLNDLGQFTPAAKELLSDLQPWLALEEHSRLADYHKLASLLETSLADAPARQRQSHDLVISDYFMRYQQDLLKRHWATYDDIPDHGIINAYERWDGWPDEVTISSLEKVFPHWLNQLKSQQPPVWAQKRLKETRPDQKLYQPWRQAFAKLQDAAAAGPWPELTTILNTGDQGSSVTQLAIQLERLGDLDTAQPWQPPRIQLDEEPFAALYDQSLKKAVKRFQQRHQLPATGRVDSKTLAQLNIAPQERKRRLAHNLRRLHHLPRQRHERHLMVNLADQRLAFIEDDKTLLEMRVITGRDGQRTPIMSQWLTSLVLNPIWNVPPGIAQQRIFPRAQNNPDYLASRDYALVEGWHTPSRYVSLDELPEDAFTDDNSAYRIVQKSGAYNQLGRAKFRLSNRQAIYLHDTPYRQHFSRQDRNLSAGCVRLEDSEKLVAALLSRSQTWTPDRVEEIYAKGEERYLQVRPRVAVYLMYWTAWTDSEGHLQWREDAYQLDHFNHPERLAKGGS